MPMITVFALSVDQVMDSIIEFLMVLDVPFVTSNIAIIVVNLISV